MEPKVQSTNNFQEEKPWLVLGEDQFYSRLLIGIEQYKSPLLIQQILEAASTEILTITLEVDGSHESLSLLKLAEVVPLQNYTLIGTTSFARSASEAIFTARTLRKSLDIDIIKLDVRINYTIPNNTETVIVANELLKDGFHIIPMINPELDIALELEKIGCSAIRLLGSTIGSGSGIVNLYVIQQIIKNLHIPIIVEGGLRSAADAALAMEIRADAILINTALAKARNPVLMAAAMK